MLRVVSASVKGFWLLDRSWKELGLGRMWNLFEFLTQILYRPLLEVLNRLSLHNKNHRMFY